MIKSLLRLLDFKRKFNSKKYWSERYKNGGHSGSGSQNLLALFKADIINAFVLKNNIEQVIEFGCGDGQQLEKLNFYNYIGFDVSLEAVNICTKKFGKRADKKFKELKNYSYEKSDLTLSLDVIYHLTEDVVYNKYMNLLFEASTKYVIVYSSNYNIGKYNSPHVKHRNFTNWVEIHKPKFKLIKKIKNKYPYDDKNETGSLADFYIFEIE